MSAPRRIICRLLGHRWVGTWKGHPTDREGEVAECCSRCGSWRSLVGDYCGDFPREAGT